ncbi:16S rRNA (cytidine(1402)-2'-O)-methyltransferase [Solemya velum gill symbiont]|nr:16S rRNA (cytidine(1402)-2'-O)-methyltransferase [Solemya velum gill symbiont]OOY60957.1 16S rRNA (cytidine(1402)-2'-O)-methyltransferase [Solemya velum gill symbiont]OOY63214.1 16S rRNA (cytidine(1402)-2'-O)-methyltransferase [Solemya velum gill symbiont]OOY64645.1 16S rRNA (cytidine(1402)-2'-O)-methyltransferase [Solemya velum gill symbiont]OOY72254.1 16S rRNA (cytidine(1402)-2'-O)-methyltransferase [Solemya velum gill symbiont]
MKDSVSELGAVMSTEQKSGVLYIVATPIGNLEDISRRAVRILSEVDLVAAEDTRHTGQLLSALGIRAELLSVHEHNEEKRSGQLIDKLSSGLSVALVSDAGTPLISDPGFVVVRACREAGARVVPVPGPSAVITALSVSGLPSDRFQFEGFLPRNSSKRRSRLEELMNLPHTLIFYESSHRLRESLEDFRTVFEASRQVVIARELTKQYETLLSGTSGELLEMLTDDANQTRGEMVVLVEPAPEGGGEELVIGVDKLLKAALDELPPSQAAAMVARLTDLRKKELYQRAMEMKEP